MVGIVCGLVLFACVVATWLLGNAVGRWAMFAVLTAAGCFVVVASPRFAGSEMLGYAVVAGLAWVIAALPTLIARRREFVSVGVDGATNVSLELVGAHGAGNTRQQH